MALALILAAGSGERLGADVPKAFVQLAGRDLLQWSLATLREVKEIQRIVLALPPATGAVEAGTTAGSEAVRGGVAWDGISAQSPGTVAVSGGATRSESVRLALAAAGPGDPVLIHDAARPLVTAELTRRTLAALATDPAGEPLDAAIAAAPVTDTIKRADGRRVVVETLERSSLWAVQTPQVFRRAALQRALDVPAGVLAQATDDAWLIERQGGRVAVVPADAENLKVTTPLDLQLAELLLTRRGTPLS
jgi:2-C-methyl-D-erythritol 4-phosphate cytidylyltransferase